MMNMSASYQTFEHKLVEMGTNTKIQGFQYKHRVMQRNKEGRKLSQKDKTQIKDRVFEEQRI